MSSSDKSEAVGQKPSHGAEIFKTKRPRLIALGGRRWFVKTDKDEGSFIAVNVSCSAGVRAVSSAEAE